jgi:hypothetical protein
MGGTPEKVDYGHDRRAPQSLTAAVEGTDYAFNTHTEKKKTGQERRVGTTISHFYSLFISYLLSLLTDNLPSPCVG